MENKEKITVTSPLLPNLQEFTACLNEIWDSKWITNNGDFHKRLEELLCEYLGVQYISLFTNGTLPLMTALQALRITGEVITTPYSFVATTHSLWWNGIKPVFVDVDPRNGNLDPDKIEAAISPKTTAIMPVHVYGNPCDTEKIKSIADKYGLKVIYDAAHAFGVTVDGKSILEAGDMSTLSFHATKVFNTIEGGALICHDEMTKKRIDYLKNFGFAGETEVVAPGINSKMDEVRAAYGILNLRQVEQAIGLRCEVAGWFVDAEKYGMTRDDLYFKMKGLGILGRRYFYPLISTFSTYRGLESSSADRLPVATNLADSVICLPIHHNLSRHDVERVLSVIRR